MVAAFLAPVAIAFLHYFVGVLLKIRRLKRKILAWVFFRVQIKLIKETRHEIEGLFDKLLAECLRIEKNISCFQSDCRTEDNQLIETYDTHYFNNLIPDKEYQYPINYFQQSISEPIDQISDKVFVNNFDESGYFTTIGQDQRVNINGLTMEDLYRIFCRGFIGGNLYHQFFNDFILEQKTGVDVFAKELHHLMEKLVKSEYNSIDEFIFTEATKDIVIARSHPSFYDYTSHAITKFAFTVAREVEIPDSLNFAKPTTDGMIKIIEITSDNAHNISFAGYRQCCEFYRLSSEKDLKID